MFNLKNNLKFKIDIYNIKNKSIVYSRNITEYERNVNECTATFYGKDKYFF